MRSVVVSVVALVVLLAPPAPSRAGRRSDGRGIEETLARAQEECCPARNHGQYVSCAAHVCNQAVKNRILRASDKVVILKHGCDPRPTTTTIKTSTTTTTTNPSTTTTTKPPTTTSTTEPTTTTSTTEPTTVTTSTVTSTTEATTTTSSTTTTTAPTTTSTTEGPASTTTTSTTQPLASSTTTTSGPAPTTTSTTLPGVREICGNCIDDDNNGLTDFEDPACCSQLQTFTMGLSRGRLRPAGSVSRLRLKSLLARTGLGQVNPLRQDVFLQIRPAGGLDLLCAKIPASKFMRMHGAFKFWDRKHMVTSARGINDLTVKIRRDGSVRLRTLGRRVQMQTPARGSLQVTVGFHDPAGDAGNRCSSTVQAFRSGRRGALLAP
jgi:hypothetical protein